MAFLIPTLKDCVQRARNSFRSEMPGSDAWVWPNNIYVVAKVFGGMIWELFGRVAFIEKQRFAMYATGTYLEEHATELGMGRKAATYASGPVALTGTAGETIAAGTTLTRSDGVVYTTDTEVVLGSLGSGTVTATCSVTGPGGNAVYGTALTCSNGEVTEATVGSAGIGGGTDTELDDDLRARILYRKRNPPQGGSKADYVIWATSVAGVTRAWPESGGCGTGTVLVWFTMDQTYDYGVPLSTDVANVQAYIDSVRPVTATVIVEAPTPYYLDVVISNLNPSTSAMRQKVANEIRAAVIRMADVSTTDSSVTFYRSWIWQGVSAVPGVEHFTVTTPADDLSIPVGAIPVVRSVTFN